MAKFDFEKDNLNNILPENHDLPVHLLAGIFKDKNQSYKLFWFQAIMDYICEGKTTLTYEQLIHRMVAEAWYMVMEYHLNLGPADALEILINQVRDTAGLSSTVKKEEVIHFLQDSDDPNIRKAKQKLVLNVPYRLQAPFLGKMTTKEWRDYNYIEALARSNSRVLYYYELLTNKKKQIHINEKWIDYLKKNEAIIRGWLQNELIQYLQRRNPNVPGIPFKLKPPEKRDLKSAMEFWQIIIQTHDLEDVYTGKDLNEENAFNFGKIHIDHFIPWSYLASDEIWNLTPTFAKINFSKSNQLPNLEEDILRLSKQHFEAFQIANSNKEIRKVFMKYKRKNLNSQDVDQKLYRKDISEKEFQDNMCSIISPIYQSAKNVGFTDWDDRNYA